MGPTIETRSRDEWLTEVKRRGGRLRRRRQLTMALVGGLALVLPVGALATLLGGDPDHVVSQLVAGPGLTPAPAGEIGPATGIEAGPAGEVPALPAEPATTTTVKPAAPGPVTAGVDDPVVRPAPTTTIPSGDGAIATQSTPLPTTTVPPAATEPAPAPCVAAEFNLTVTMDKSAYRPGETVSGTAILEKRSPGKCLLPDWYIRIGFFNAAGRDVAQIARTSLSTSNDNQYQKWVDTCGESRCPRWVEPGAVRTDTFGWETVDCSNYPPGPIMPAPGDTSYCVPFPAGTYTVVAEWTGEGGGPPVRTTFKLTT